jgi:hypothetical protein
LVLVRVTVIWIATIEVVWIVRRARSSIAVAVVAIAVTVVRIAVTVVIVVIAITVVVVAGVLRAVPLVPIVGVASLPRGVA